MLTAYAMHGFELVEKLLRGPSFSLFRVLQALTDAFLCINAGRNVEQALIGFGILHDGRCLPPHREHHRAFAFFLALDEVAGTPAESRQRLDVLGDIQHEPAPSEAPI
jgi:hypothetical protein